MIRDGETGTCIHWEMSTRSRRRSQTVRVRKAETRLAPHCREIVAEFSYDAMTGGPGARLPIGDQAFARARAEMPTCRCAWSPAAARWSLPAVPSG
jgi:hypothetical protein